jgi:plastocyanin
MNKVMMMASVLAMLSVPALAETEVFEIAIKDHKFNPDTVEVPAGKKVKLLIKNQDPTPEEFESHKLNREKVIKGNSEGVIFVGPLEAGEYPFFGEFNEKTAQGKLIAK